MAFLEFIRSLARRDTPPTLDDLRAALAEADSATAEARERCSRLASDRAAILLDAGDKELDRVERELQLAQRDTDRAEAASSALRERIADAEALAERARLDAIHAAAREAERRGRELIAKAYPAACQKVLAVLRELAEIEATRKAANRELQDAGDARQVPDPDELLRPTPPCGFTPARILESTVLLSVDDPTFALWPAGLEIDVGLIREDRRHEWPNR